MGERGPQRPTELLYVPRDSFAPVLAAAGITLAAVGAFAGWFVALVGALLILAALRSWAATANDEISRMRREQRVDTAVLPAIPVRGEGKRG